MAASPTSPDGRTGRQAIAINLAELPSEPESDGEPTAFPGAGPWWPPHGPPVPVPVNEPPGERIHREATDMFNRLVSQEVSCAVADTLARRGVFMNLAVTCVEPAAVAQGSMAIYVRPLAPREGEHPWTVYVSQDFADEGSAAEEASVAAGPGARGDRFVCAMVDAKPGLLEGGGITGVRRRCREFPACARLLVALARIAFPGFKFTSVGLFRNMQTALHKDANNLPASRNGICALSSFEGGQLRLHRADGPVNLSLSEGPLQFDPFLEHETLPWANGLRIVLVAFSVSRLERLTPEHRAVLTAFDIPMPLSKDQLGPASQFSQDQSKPASQCPQDDGEAGMFLELFAGTARLSQAFTRLGFQALAFDKVCRSSHPVQALDFADRSECEVVLQLIQDHASSLQYVHMAPPQETCLAARNKESANNPAPPARSPAQPLGLHELPESLQRRVAEANDLYIFCRDVFLLCRTFNIPVSVEAPASSLFWLLPFIQDLLSGADNHVVDFHECMHGGDRDRKLRWLCSAPWFKPLGLSCNRQHSHAPWNAASDAGTKGAYPPLLCARVAELVASQVCGIPTAPSLFGPASSVTRLAYEKQPRKQRALVSEFGAYDAWAVPLGLTACPPALLKAYPKGARAVRRKLLHWGQIRACVLPSLDFAVLESTLGSNWKWSMDSHAPPLEEGDQPICKVCGFMSDSTFEDLCEVLWIDRHSPHPVRLRAASSVGGPPQKDTRGSDR
ncbi:unnamed protein product [Symbiodinium sp. CCMP2592]|nr:unnamed protein product [Symbiodinium sp. CCMP2592]